MSRTPPSSPPLEIYLLGLIEVDDALLLQRRLVYDLGESPSGGALILCEHPPTITVGRSGSRAHIAADDDELKGRDLPIRWVNRGGGCVLHLPGQLAAYVAYPLDRSGLTLMAYLERLHQAIEGVLRDFDLTGARCPGTSGVFLGNARVATVGVAVRRWIAYHGLTINVGPYLEPFRLIQEPVDGVGSGPLRQTSMEAQRQRPAPMPKVRESLIRHLEAGFGLTAHHLYTQHPLIRRKVRPHAYAQSPG